MFKFFKRKNNEPLTYKQEQVRVILTDFRPKYLFYKDIIDDKSIEHCVPYKNFDFICIADTHGCLLSKNDDFNNLVKELEQGCDAIILLGDIRQDELSIIVNLNNGRFPLLAVKGNHDDMNQFEDFPQIIDLDKNVVEINDLKVAGLCGSIKYKGCEFPSYTQQESIDAVSNIERADILITHAKLYIESDDNIPSYNCHVGLLGSTKYFYENRCFLNIHGHDHHKSFDDTISLINRGKSICVYGVERINISNINS